MEISSITVEYYFKGDDQIPHFKVNIENIELMQDYYSFQIYMYMTMCTLYSINYKQIIDYN